MTKHHITASDEEIEAWANGELPEADVERVMHAVLTDSRAAAQFHESLQFRALGYRLANRDAMSLIDEKCNSCVSDCLRSRALY